MDGFESRLALDRKGHPIGCPFLSSFWSAGTG